MTALPDGDGESPNARSVSITIGADDLSRMQRLTLLRNYRRPRAILALTALPITLSAVVAGFIGAADGRVRFADLIPLVLALYAVVAVTIILRWLLVPLRARRMLRESPALEKPVQLAWSDDSLTATSAYGTGVLPWCDLYGWAEDRHVFAIYQTRGVAQTVPKRLLSVAQIEDFRRCVGQIPDRRHGVA